MHTYVGMYQGRRDVLYYTVSTLSHSDTLQAALLSSQLNLTFKPGPCRPGFLKSFHSAKVCVCVRACVLACVCVHPRGHK